MKNAIAKVMALLLTGWSFAAQAATTTFKGVSVDYGGASTNWVDGALVLKYTGSSSLAISNGAVKADILVVGGGGGGGGGYSSSYGGSGGGGGKVTEVERLIVDGDKLLVAIGSGGAGGVSQKAGNKGGTSSVSGEGFESVEAEGGAAGAAGKKGSPSAGKGASGSGTAGVKSEITGDTYGVGGAAGDSNAPGSQNAHTGDGGKGGMESSTSGKRKGGDGGSGIVVVRLKEAIELLKGLDLRVGETVSEFRDEEDQPIEFVYSEVACQSSVDLVASVVETADGKVGIVGRMSGTAEVSIVKGGKTYVCTVTVSSLVTGNYWAGAREVAVTNASAVKYVGDDLVITYLNTNAAIVKSFTLPQATTARLLAVGGGGAGGQDDTYNSSYGLPGGGGAGGMVTNSQDFAAATYLVTVGAGGVAPRTATACAGANGGDSTLKLGETAVVTALGGGGGGRSRSGSSTNTEKGKGQPGGSGGGGSFYGGNSTGARVGGAATQPSPGLGNSGGKGGHMFYGAGGGGAGGPGGDTKSCPSYNGTSFAYPTKLDIYCSGVGGAGVSCDITGENLEYARGGAGGVPRLYAFYYHIDGQIYYTKTEPTAQQKSSFDGGKCFTVEASDGQPGRNGYGDGGGGGGQGYMPETVSFAGSGGDGIVVVRIPPYAVPDGQHEHTWEYALEGGAIVATCTAEGDCFYKQRPPTLSLDAVDAEATGRAYAGAAVVNGVTGATGLSVLPPFYEGVNETVYEKTRTPPSEPGEYRVWLVFEGLEIAAAFKIVESGTGIAGVCRSQKTSARVGDTVTITLSASIDGDKAINGGNVLLLGSRCNAHSMATGAVEKAVNALSPYANVRWYAFGESDPANNLESQLTQKGESVPYTESPTGKITGETVHLAGGNHFVFKEMMDALYAELVEKKNLSEPYDFILLEFDGNLLGREGKEPYQLVYTLPEGWTAEKAAILKAAMDEYYTAGRVGWIVPDVNKPKSDSGYTGEYPWTSQPEFIWQRAFLNATETDGYRCPIQVNYEDPDNLVERLKETVINGFFGRVVVTDVVKAGLDIKSVTPQFRNEDGFWADMAKTGENTYEADEPTSGKTITATVAIDGQKVETTFDAAAVQTWAVGCDVNWGTDLRVKIATEIKPEFFDDVAENDWKETNEGAASFKFEDSKLEDGFEVVTTNASPRIQNVKPDPVYAVEDWVGFYDGAGHAAVVTVTDPDPAEHPLEVRYALAEDGAYVSAPPITNCCAGVETWVEIADPQNQYHTVTNRASVTILPRVVVERANDARVAYDGAPKTEPGHHYDEEKSEEEAEKRYLGEGAAAIGFVDGEGFDVVPMTEDSQRTEIGSHANTIDAESVTFKENTNPDNYIFIYLPGTIEVTTVVTSESYEGIYDGESHTITVDPDGGTVEYFVGGAWVADAPVYADVIATDVVFRVKKEGEDDFIGSNTVTITPRDVTLTSGSKLDFVYDGAPHAHETLTAEGFVAGEGLATTSGWATVTAVGEGQVDNAFVYTLKPNTRAANYSIEVVKGKIAVVAAAIQPKNPAGDGAEENPGEEPTEADGTTLWAQNIVKVYDGQGTNVVPAVYNAVAGNDFAFKYSTDGVTWADDLAFTNVVTAQKVHFRAVPQGASANYAVAAGYAFVTIEKRPATITFTAADKVFDGAASAICTATNFENVVEGEGFALDTAAMSFAFDTPAFGAGKTVTASGYDDSLVTAVGDAKKSNYVFTFVPTTTAAITKEKQTGVTSTPYFGTYDGAGHAITVMPMDEADTIEYLVGGAWVADAPAHADAGVYTNAFRVTKENHEDFIGSNTVTIAAKPATLTSGTKTDFVYDGAPHAHETLTAEGFVAGEGLATTSGWATVTAVAEGQVDNAFEYTLKANTRAENYAIAVVKGKIAVVAAAIQPKNPAGGGAEENPGEEPTDTDGTTLWAQNIVKVYDGLGTNVVPVVYNAVAGNDFAFEYSTDGATWTDDLAFTNMVAAQKVHFRAVPQGAAANYAVAAGYAFVTITNRPATITFTAADKVFDGTTSATCAATNFENVVEGEGFALDTSAMSFAFDTADVGTGKTVTATGYEDSLVTPVGDAKKSNYVFTFVDTATAAITKEKQTGVTSEPYSGTYDGAGHTITVDPDGGTVEYLAGGAWVADAPAHADAGVYTNAFRVTKENFEDFHGTNTVTIAPRDVTLTSGSKTDFVYDGAPHAHETLTAEGFVAGEGLATTSGWAAVTTVGEGQIDNTFTYTLKANTRAENYAIAVVKGKIAVVAAAIQPKNPAGDGAEENPGEEPTEADGTTLWAQNIVKVYDGLGTNVVPVVYNAVAGNDFAFEYSTDGVTWTDDLAFTNVVAAQKVHFRAVPQGAAANYAVAAGYAFVTIEKRPATITFAAADKVFDGTTSATCAATNFANLVAGEDFAFDTSAMSFAFDTPAFGTGKTVTASGYDDSLVTAVGDAKKSNYVFTFDPTTTAAITKEKQTGVTSEPYSGTYDGAGHTITVDPDGGTVEYLAGGAWVADAPAHADAGVHATVFRVTKENFEDFIGTNTVTIAPKPATISFTAADKVYDGTVAAACSAAHFADLVGDDALELDVSAMSFAFDTADVGEGKAVTATGYADALVTAVGETLKSNYSFTFVDTATAAVTPRSVGPVPADPDHPEGPFAPAEGFAVAPIEPLVYDGTAQEPEVAVTNGTTELVRGVDYAVSYGANVNATEEAYALVEGKGNYSGCFTNYFTILPRAVTLKSGTKTMYLDPTKPGEAVECSNGLVWVESGSFATNALTGVLDGFAAEVLGRLESDTPAGPAPNAFTAIVDPGLATNYCFTLLPGELAILSTPSAAHEEITEEIPSPHGGVLEVVMNNADAGEYAADKPPELNAEAQTLEKGPTDKVEFRMVLSTNVVEESYSAVTSAVAAAARTAGAGEKEIGGYVYERFDVAVEKIHEHCDEDGFVVGVETNDWGNNVSRLLTIRIPHAFNPRLIAFSVWRNHTNATENAVVELPYYDPAAEVESWETNATEVVLRVRKFSVYVLKSLYPTTPMLAGAVRWKYAKAENAFYAGLDVVCTNGDHAAVENLCYLLEDGDGSWLRNPAGAGRLSDTSGWTSPDGRVFGVVPLAAEPLSGAPSLWTTNRYGVTDETFFGAEYGSRHVVPTAAERLIALATTDVVGLVNGDTSALGDALGYLVWQERGDAEHLFWCPVADGWGESPAAAFASAAEPETERLENALVAGRAVEFALEAYAGWRVKGLPSGLKFDKKTGRIHGTPKKPGRFTVTFSRKAGRKTEKEQITLDVYQGNFPDGVPAGADVFADGILVDVVFDDETSIPLADGTGRVLHVGAKVDWPVRVEGLDGVKTTLRAKKLPTGLRLVKTKDGSYSIRGTAKKAMERTVVLTASNKYKWTGSATFRIVTLRAPEENR